MVKFVFFGPYNALSVVFLILGVLTKKMRKLLVLMEYKAMETYYEDEKRSSEVLRVKKASLNGQKECMVGHAQ